MAKNNAAHTPNCKIPPCREGCQNVVCHEHANCCCVSRDSDELSCTPQCRGSLTLFDNLRNQYNEPDRWPPNWRQKFATLRRNWSYHSKFSNYSLQTREDLSDENMTAVNINCGTFNCSPEAYHIREAAVSKNNRCSCSTKNKMRQDTVSYYDEPAQSPQRPSQHYESSFRNCSRDCPNRNQEISFEDDYETENENSRYTRRNRSASTPGRYSRRGNFNNNESSIINMLEQEASGRTNTSNSRRHQRSAGGQCRGSNDTIRTKGYQQSHEDYINMNNKNDAMLHNSYSPVHKTHAYRGNTANKDIQRRYKCDDLCDVVSQDLSIVFNENPSSNSKAKASQINILFKQPKPNVSNRKADSSVNYMQKIRADNKLPRYTDNGNFTTRRNM